MRMSSAVGGTGDELEDDADYEAAFLLSDALHSGRAVLADCSDNLFGSDSEGGEKAASGDRAGSEGGSSPEPVESDDEGEPAMAPAKFVAAAVDDGAVAAATAAEKATPAESSASAVATTLFVKCSPGAAEAAATGGEVDHSPVRASPPAARSAQPRSPPKCLPDVGAAGLAAAEPEEGDTADAAKAVPEGCGEPSSGAIGTASPAASPPLRSSPSATAASGEGRGAWCHVTEAERASMEKRTAGGAWKAEGGKAWLPPLLCPLPSGEDHGKVFLLLANSGVVRARPSAGHVPRVARNQIATIKDGKVSNPGPKSNSHPTLASSHACLPPDCHCICLIPDLGGL